MKRMGPIPVLFGYISLSNNASSMSECNDSVNGVLRISITNKNQNL